MGQAAVGQAAVGQAAAAVGAGGASAAVAAAAAGVGGTVVHAADAADFDAHPAADGTEPAVADDIGPGTAAAAGVLAAGTAAAVGLAAGIAAVALAVDAVADSDIFVCAPVLVAVAVPPALPFLASPSLSEIILTFQL